MTRHWQSAIAIGACLGAAGSEPAAAAESPFDGRWNVQLVCPDIKGKSGFVKGYEFTFPISIHDGDIEGEYGAPGHPSSLVFSGRVSDDGSLDIKATGNTGKSEYTVGRVAQGSQYGYTMHGKLAGASGQATRTELRPCTATFTKS